MKQEPHHAAYQAPEIEICTAMVEKGFINSLGTSGGGTGGGTTSSDPLYDIGGGLGDYGYEDF